MIEIFCQISRRLFANATDTTCGHRKAFVPLLSWFLADTYPFLNKEADNFGYCRIFISRPFSKFNELPLREVNLCSLHHMIIVYITMYTCQVTRLTIFEHADIIAWVTKKRTPVIHRRPLFNLFYFLEITVLLKCSARCNGVCFPSL